MDTEVRLLKPANAVDAKLLKLLEATVEVERTELASARIPVTVTLQGAVPLWYQPAKSSPKRAKALLSALAKLRLLPGVAAKTR